MSVQECTHNRPKKLVIVDNRFKVNLCDACIKEFEKFGIKKPSRVRFKI